MIWMKLFNSAGNSMSHIVFHEVLAAVSERHVCTTLAIGTRFVVSGLAKLDVNVLVSLMTGISSTTAVAIVVSAGVLWLFVPLWVVRILAWSTAPFV
jgi:hypothetical protein